MSGKMDERFIAVDNVCAWPNLTRLDDELVVAIYNQPVHGRWHGDIDIWGSDVVSPRRANRRAPA